MKGRLWQVVSRIQKIPEKSWVVIQGFEGKPDDPFQSISDVPRAYYWHDIIAFCCRRWTNSSRFFVLGGSGEDAFSWIIMQNLLKALLKVLKLRKQVWQAFASNVGSMIAEWPNRNPAHPKIKHPKRPYVIGGYWRVIVQTRRNPHHISKSDNVNHRQPHPGAKRKGTSKRWIKVVFSNERGSDFVATTSTKVESSSPVWVLSRRIKFEHVRIIEVTSFTTMNQPLKLGSNRCRGDHQYLKDSSAFLLDTKQNKEEIMMATSTHLVAATHIYHAYLPIIYTVHI